MHKKCKVCYPSVTSESSRAGSLVQKFMPLSLAVLFWLIFQWMWVSGILKQIDRPEQWDYSKPSLNRTAAFSQLNSLHSFKILMIELRLTSWEKPWMQREGQSAQWEKCSGMSPSSLSPKWIWVVWTLFNKLCFLSSVAVFFFFFSHSEFHYRLLFGDVREWICMEGRRVKDKGLGWIMRVEEELTGERLPVCHLSDFKALFTLGLLKHIAIK